MADIIKRTRAFLRRQGRSKKEIEQAINFMQTTCVACIHSAECRAKGIVNEPYHPKCERHELMDNFVKEECPIGQKSHK